MENNDWLGIPLITWIIAGLWASILAVGFVRQQARLQSVNETSWLRIIRPGVLAIGIIAIILIDKWPDGATLLVGLMVLDFLGSLEWHRNRMRERRSILLELHRHPAGMTLPDMNRELNLVPLRSLSWLQKKGYVTQDTRQSGNSEHTAWLITPDGKDALKLGQL